MQRILFLLSVVLILSGCKSTQKSSRSFEPEPSWVTKSPISSGYYIGVFGVQKTNPNYREAAKKGALDNLSSEISVNISGESFLHTIEKNGDLSQEFQQNVKVSSKENLEGFELIGNWDGETEYWVYYRLSKSKHAALKKEKLDAAMHLAKELYAKAIVKHNESHYHQAFLLCIQSLEAVSEYFDKPLKTTFKEKEVYLATEVFSFLQQLVSEVKLEAPFKNKVVKLGEELTGNDIYVNVYGKQNKPLVSIPLKAEYKAVFMKKFRVNSNEHGRAEFNLGKINQSQKTQTIHAQVDFKRLAEEVTKDRLVLALTKYLASSEVKATLTIEPPKVYVVSKEKAFNRTVASKLSSAVKQSLISKGFEVAASRSSADLVLYINGDTQSSGVNRGVHTVYFKGNIEVFQNSDNRIVYSEAFQEEKSLQIDKYRASDDAYNKAESYLKRRLIPKLANQFFSF